MCVARWCECLFAQLQHPFTAADVCCMRTCVYMYECECECDCLSALLPVAAPSPKWNPSAVLHACMTCFLHKETPTP